MNEVLESPLFRRAARRYIYGLRVFAMPVSPVRSA